MADHDRHDPELVAAAADREGRLADVLHACADCLTLLHDLRALATATPGAAIPRRSRDYRLTVQDADRLGRRGWLRLLAVFGTGRDAVTRPLAVSLTTLGLVGLLLGAVPASPPFAAGAAAGHIEGVTQPLRATDPTDTTGSITTTGQGSGDAALPVEGAPGIVPEGGPASGSSGSGSDGLALRILALSFLGLGLGTFAARRVASTRRGMR